MNYVVVFKRMSFVIALVLLLGAISAPAQVWAMSLEDELRQCDSKQGDTDAWAGCIDNVIARLKAETKQSSDPKAPCASACFDQYDRGATVCLRIGGETPTTTQAKDMMNCMVNVIRSLKDCTKGCGF